MTTQREWRGTWPVVVGEAPGPKGLPKCPLFPHPERSAGHKLCEMSGVTRSAWLTRVERVNLLAEYPKDGWRAGYAASQADNLGASLLLDRRLILCGRRVAKAFGFKPADSPWLRWAYCEKTRAEAVVIPHPSGRCREYNDPKMVAAVSDLLREAFVGLPRRKS